MDTSLFIKSALADLFGYDIDNLSQDEIDNIVLNLTEEERTMIFNYNQ